MSSIFTTIAVAAIVISVIVAIIASLIFFNSSSTAKKSIERYFSIISAMSIIIVFISFLYSSIHSANAAKQASLQSQLALDQEIYSALYKYLQDNYPYSLEFTYQIIPFSKNLKQLLTVPIDDINKKRSFEFFASGLFIESFDITFKSAGGLSANWDINNRGGLGSAYRGIIAGFSSPILRENWNQIKALFNDEFAYFIDFVVIPKSDEFIKKLNEENINILDQRNY